MYEKKNEKKRQYLGECIHWVAADNDVTVSGLYNISEMNVAVLTSLIVN